jgi:hypothetical protein
MFPARDRSPGFARIGHTSSITSAKVPNQKRLAIRTLLVPRADPDAPDGAIAITATVR